MLFLCTGNSVRSQTIHWSIPDPAWEGGSDTATHPAFERTAAEIEARVGFFLELINDTNRARR